MLDDLKERVRRHMVRPLYLDEDEWDAAHQELVDGGLCYKSSDISEPHFILLGVPVCRTMGAAERKRKAQEAAERAQYMRDNPRIKSGGRQWA